MTKLIKVADWTGGDRINVVFVHGLGGNAYDTWRRGAEDNTFWPVWLARDIPGLTAWTLHYDAALTSWFGTAMPIQDRAKNVLECLLGQRELKKLPLVFVCHSLGGLVVKQVLRAADGRRAYSAETQALLDSVKGVVFIATPHTGSMQATLLDKLRLVAWPSASTLDLVRNNANLRDLNAWYRNWSGSIRHKVFYEKRGTATGVIVGDDIAIVERLAASDRSNTGWQRDLLVSYNNVGNVLETQGKLDDALKTYRDSLAIVERLAASDRSNTDWQHNLRYSIERIGSVAYRYVLAGNFASALEASDLVISLAPDTIWLHINRAHALMFLGRVEDARIIYLRYRGEKNVQDEKSWETVVLDDFAELRKAGLTHPMIDEIKDRFAAGG